MKAALFMGPGKNPDQDLTTGNPKNTRVKIRNKAAGVCGTDVHIFHGAKGSADVQLPVVLGHEFAGEVVAVGSGVTAVKAGDRVAVDPNIYCQTCYYCRTGRKQLCENLRAIGVNCNGGFAEYSIVPEQQVYPLADNVDFEAGAMAEPLACCLHGVDLAQIQPGDTVCVIGGGAIGQLMVQLAKLAGAAQVFLSEPVAQRRQIALENGADYVVDPTAEDPAEVIYRLNSRGVDVVIESWGMLRQWSKLVRWRAKEPPLSCSACPSQKRCFP